MPNRYWVGGTATWDNTAGTKWATISGGVGGASAPTAADDVFFDANSGSGIVTTAATATCLSANFTNFIGTFNVATNWTISTSLTFGAGMTITGSGTVTKTGLSGTWTSNGVTYTGSVIFSPASFPSSMNFADDWVILGSVSRTGANGHSIVGLSGVRTITIGGSLTGWNGGVQNINFILNGSGSLNGSFSGNGGASITINTSGTINHNGAFNINAFTLTYISGTFNSTSTLGIGNLTSVLNVPGITFLNLDFVGNVGGAQIVTLNSNLDISGNITSTGAGGFFNGAFTVFLGGNLNIPGDGLAGTATLEMNGTNNAFISATSIQNNLNINKSGTPTPATVTLNSFTWGAAGRILQRTAGNINPGSSTISILANTNVTINNMTFWNLTIPGASTITQNVLNTIQNNLTLAATNNVTFDGTAGWTCANLLCSTAGRTITLQSLVTYTTTTSVNMLGTNALRILMRSSDLTIPYDLAIWTLVNGATQSMVYVSATAINSSLGQTIWSFQGTTNGIDPSTLNWNPGTKPETQGITFVN
jgi:hypothetical protein